MLDVDFVDKVSSLSSHALIKEYPLLSSPFSSLQDILLDPQSVCRTTTCLASQLMTRLFDFRFECGPTTINDHESQSSSSLASTIINGRLGR
jgi:hypothetical protein